MPTIRDVQIQFSERFEQKQDVRPIIRAVLCDSTGLITGSGSVFADADNLLVWYRPVGSSQPAWARCVRLEPQLGLGVIIGYAEGSNELEVLSDDPFLRGSVADKKFMSVNGRDFEPGGRLQMWLYTKAIVPLATVPAAAGGLAVDVVTGDYETAAGARQTFNGSLTFSIAASQPAGPNEHLLVGLYIDSSNTLQSVDGSTVATSSDAPEPSWPAGAVRLAVVDLDDTQTSIDFDADISDRRLLYPYPGSGAILQSFLDAKGDLITATADDTPAILSVGTDGQHLIADSAQAEGIDWSNIVDLAGVADALIIDANGDTTLSAPTDDQIDIEIGGSDIVVIDSTGISLPITGDDIYIAGDEAGVKQRNVDFNFTSILDHFDGAFSGWSWAAYTNFATPGNIDVTTWPSHVGFYDSSPTNNDKAFAYKSSSTEPVTARLFSTLESCSGIRVDDGTDSNYVEFYAQTGGFATSVTIRYRVNTTGGGLVGPTTLVTLADVRELVMQMDKQGTAWVFFIGENQMNLQVIGAYTLGANDFTQTRQGLFHQWLSATGGSARSSVYDWYKEG